TGTYTIAVRGKPPVDEARHIFRVGLVGQRPLEIERRAHDSGADVTGMNVEARREVELVEEILEARNLLAVQLYVVKVLAGTDLDLVPAPVAEHESMEDAEAVALRVASRRPAGGADEVGDGEAGGAVSARQEPTGGCWWV